MEKLIAMYLLLVISTVIIHIRNKDLKKDEFNNNPLDEKFAFRFAVFLLFFMPCVTILMFFLARIL